jgi:ribosome biogenesis GTPase
MILEALPRRNKLARRSAVPMPGAHAHEQVIVANVDQAVLVFAAAEPPPKWNLLDRYLVSTEAAGVPALICITKIDLLPGDPEEAGILAAIEEYRQIGYPVVMASAKTGAGLEALREALRGRVSALLGKSGVGKTSLLNALQPGLGLRVNAVSRVNGKGRHTTSHLEMFTLDLPPGEAESEAESTPHSETAIVDTPGVREFGLWEISGEDLALFFPEMVRFVGRCQFGLDCRHNEEPGCAIRKATMAGQITPRRYQSYLRLREET